MKAIEMEQRKLELLTQQFTTKNNGSNDEDDYDDSLQVNLVGNGPLVNAVESVISRPKQSKKKLNKRKIAPT